MHAGELGVNAVVVMEQYSEVRLALRVAAKLGVRPRLGVRAKLATRHSGHWGSTSGAPGRWHAAGKMDGGELCPGRRAQAHVQWSAAVPSFCPPCPRPRPIPNPPP